MKVNENTLKAYNNTSSNKSLRIYFPNLDYTIDKTQIHQETMFLREALIEGRNIEFVGCISSEFSIQIQSIPYSIKNEKMEVYIVADNTEEIPLFKGVVDSAVRQTNKNYKKITAFDKLYSKGNIDIASWYNSLNFPISIKKFREGLFNLLEIEQEDVYLPNDSVFIRKEYNPVKLQALPVIKAICQINGAFGIINRAGKFEYRILSDSLKKKGAFPGLSLFPGPSTFPGYIYDDGLNKIQVNDVAFYKAVDYQDYSVKPVEKVTIRQSDSDKGITYGEGTNNYIIQGNMFTLNKTDAELRGIAQKIYASVKNVEFVPFEAENSGYPFVEVGLDAVEYYAYNFEASANSNNRDIYTKKTFYVFNRTLKGIQDLKDTYGVDGDEYQKEFITDVSTQIEQLRQNINVEIGNQIELNIPKYTYTRDELDLMFGNMFKVESVKTLPLNPDANTVYLIQGEVVVE